MIQRENDLMALKLPMQVQAKIYFIPEWNRDQFCMTNAHEGLTFAKFFSVCTKHRPTLRKLRSSLVSIADRDTFQRDRRSYENHRGKHRGNTLSGGGSEIFTTENSTVVIAQIGGTATLPCGVKKFNSGVVSAAFNASAGGGSFGEALSSLCILTPKTWLR